MVYENAVSIHVQVGYGQSNMSSHVQLTQTRLHIIYCHCVLFAPAIYNITSHEGPVFYCIWDRCQSRSTTCVGWCPAVCAAHEPPGCFWKKYKQVLRSDTLRCKKSQGQPPGIYKNLSKSIGIQHNYNLQPQLVIFFCEYQIIKLTCWRVVELFQLFLGWESLLGIKLSKDQLVRPTDSKWALHSHDWRQELCKRLKGIEIQDPVSQKGASKQQRCRK